MVLSPYYKPLFTLITVPACFACGIGLLPLVILPFEEVLLHSPYHSYIVIDGTERARSLLRVIATGSITTLSLTYSLVLLVFTLAAANIGPRLMRRFSSDLVNQITAGLFGGTFLYSVVALYRIQPEVVPKGTVTGAAILAIASVFQLIYFMRHVAETITIDDEITKISKRLQRQLSELADRNSTNFSNFETEGAETRPLKAHRTGYIGTINMEGLLSRARELDVIIEFQRPYGAFVHRGETIATLKGSESCEIVHSHQLSKFIMIDDVRSEAGTIQFEINLLIEIALRALSPSVSDTFTALACLDSLSAAFATMSREKINVSTHADCDGQVRVALCGMSLRQLFGQAYHPIRRASGSNIMMAQGLARSLSALAAIQNEEINRLVEQHGEILIQQIQSYNLLETDVQSVIELLSRHQNEGDGIGS